MTGCPDDVADVYGGDGIVCSNLQNECLIEQIDDIYDAIGWTTVFPDGSRKGDSFRVFGGMYNKLDVPLAVSLRTSSLAPDVCSLAPGTGEGDDLPIGSNMILAAEGESYTVGATTYHDSEGFDLIGKSLSVGTCHLKLTAEIMLVSGAALTVGSQEDSHQTRVPLLTTVDLGKVVYDCTGTNSDVYRYESALTEPAEYAAGDREIVLEQEVLGGTQGVEHCNNHSLYTWVDWDDENGHDHDKIIKLEAPGMYGSAKESSTKKDLEAGDHQFTINSVVMEGWFDADCSLFLVAGGILLFAGGIGLAALIAVLLFIIGSTGPCADDVHDLDEPFEVDATVVDDDDDDEGCSALASGMFLQGVIATPCVFEVATHENASGDPYVNPDARQLESGATVATLM